MSARPTPTRSCAPAAVAGAASTAAATTRVAALLLFATRLHLLADLLGHRGVAQRGDVSELASLRDVLQEPPHDLAGPRLREVVGVDDPLRPGELADLLGHVRADDVVEAVLLPGA